MKKILDKIFDLNNFKLLFTFVLFFYTLPYTIVFTSHIMKFALVYGLITIAYDTYKNKTIFKSKSSLILGVMLILMLVGVFVNFRNSLVGDFKTWLYLVVETIGLYIFDKKEKTEDTIKKSFKFLNIAIGITFVCAILTMIVFIADIKTSVNTGYNELLIGVFEGRLWGIYGNPNTCGQFGFVSLFISLICLDMVKNYELVKENNLKLYKNILWVNVFIQFSNIILSVSRSSIVSLVCGVLMLSFILAKNYFEKQGKKWIIRSTIVSLVTVVLMIFGMNILKVGYAIVPNIRYMLFAQTSGEKMTVEKAVKKYERDYKKSEDVSNGRLEIWKAAFKTTKGHSLFGIGTENVNREMNKNLPKIMVEESEVLGANAHNLYIHMYMSHGIFVLGTFLAFLIYCAIKAITYLFNKENTKNKNYHIILLYTVLIISILSNNMFESNMLYYFSTFMIPLFWLNAGTLMKLIDDEKKTKKSVKKKVLFSIDSLAGGGAEKVLKDILNNLDKNKYDLTVKTVYNEGVYIEQLDKNIQYKTIVKNTSVFKKRIMNRIIKYLPSEMLYTLFENENYDVEVSFLEFLSTKIYAGSTSDAKKIAWVHTDLSKNLATEKLFLTRKRMTNAYKQFDNIITVSKTSKKIFTEVTGINKNVEYIYNLIPTDEILKLSKEKLSKDEMNENCFKMISVGRLEEVKGYERLFNIVKKLVEEKYDVCLYIIGDGSLKDKLKTFIKDNNLEKNIKLLGFKKNPYKYINKCDLYICSSLVEGFSLAFCEAAILGVPIISTKCSGSDEILDKGKYGEITKNNEESLYQGIKSILDDKTKYQNMKESIIQRKSFFDKEKIIEQIDATLAN